MLYYIYIIAEPVHPCLSGYGGLDRNTCTHISLIGLTILALFSSHIESNRPTPVIFWLSLGYPWYPSHCSDQC